MMRFSIVLITALFSVNICDAQQTQQSRKNNNWFNMDPDKDRFAGVSSDRTYAEMLNGMTPDTVIVAVIDGGTDVNHPDLKANIWINSDEIQGNGIDDDKNGYADDIHGWNFLGNSTETLNEDNLEMTRQYRMYLAAKKSGAPQTADMKAAAKMYPKELKSTQKMFDMLKKLKTAMIGIEESAKPDSVRASHIAAYNTNDKSVKRILDMVARGMEAGVEYSYMREQLLEGYDQLETAIKYHLNLDYNARAAMGLDSENYADSLYGNNDVTGGDPDHGTHVAGIIGAVRNNDTGINGVAAAVRIMVVRAVPDGDEFDRDIANSIRYAVDNGARIINMSFGKELSPGKKYIDEAMAYAAAKDVLIVHAAGNESANIDKTKTYPNAMPLAPENGTGALPRISGWVEVGASNSSGDAGSFSNYGRKTVDLFAPGVNIYSTVYGDGHRMEDGTSMAAPMVSGVAAIIRSYFPQLSAEQVRNILVATVTKVPFDTTRPGTKKKVGFNELCATGGIVNAFKAVEMAKGIVN
jgi:subtilisin family serine protease